MWGVTASTRVESFDNPLDSIGPLFFLQVSLDRQLAGDARRAWHASARVALGGSWERSARGGDLVVGPTVRLPTRGAMTLHASLRGGVGAAAVDQLHDEEHLVRASIVLEPSLILSLSRRLSMHVGATARNAVYQRSDLMRGPPQTEWSLWRPEYGAQLGLQARF